MSPSRRPDPSQLFVEDRLHGSVYTDPEVFELELERIFGRTWVYVAHETEVARPGYYKTTRIGRQPVIVSRGADDGVLRLFFNRCRHRAAIVCQEEAGNANFFRCPYHGWTFTSGGELVGVPFRKGYGPDFQFADYPLLQVPRVSSYRGFVFASLNADVCDLETHLANARPYLDRLAGSGPEGIEVRAGVHKYGYDGNWKLQLENAVDNYHVSFVHQSFVDIIARQTGSRGRWHDGYCRDLGNGQGLLEFPQTGPPATGGEPFNLVIFPNFAWVGTQIRVVQPVAIDRSEVLVYPTLLAGVSDDVNEKRLNQEVVHGFIRAYERAKQMVMEDEELLISHTVQDTGMERELVEQIVLPEWQEGIDVERLQDFADLMYEFEVIPETVDVSEFTFEGVAE